MMAHRTVQMDKMKKIAVCDVFLVLGSGTLGMLSSIEYIKARQMFSTSTFSY